MKKEGWGLIWGVRLGVGAEAGGPANAKEKK
jgi:hypothetical protein